MPKARFFFLNIGHSIDHLFMLMFPAVAALAAVDLSSEYGDVLRLATGSFIAFGICSLPMGWLADRLSREFMISVFFIGMGVSMFFIGLSGNLALYLFINVNGGFRSDLSSSGPGDGLTRGRRRGQTVGCKRCLGKYGCCGLGPFNWTFCRLRWLA